MNKYQSIIIVNPDLSDEEKKSVISDFENLINKEGKVETTDEIGMKTLAYQIKKHSEGYYVKYTFEAEPTLITELERNYRINDSILKFMTLRAED